MSSIIKSERVSIGKAVSIDLDAPRVIKKSQMLKNENVEEKILEEMNQEKMQKEVGQGDVEQVQEQVLEEQVVLVQQESVITEEEKQRILAEYMEEARKKSELFFEDEMKKAYSEGIAKAENEAQNIIQEANNKANEIILEVSELKKKVAEEYKQAFDTIEPDVIALSVDIAMKILNKEIENDDEYILNIVKDAMDKIAVKKDTILKVSEKDYTIVIGNMDVMLARVEGFGDVTVVKEPSLPEGSCLIETEYGTIDGSIKTRVEQIKNEIEKMLNR